MDTKLSNNIKEIGAQVIEISNLISEKMYTWEDFFKDFPDSNNENKVAGFKTRPGSSNLEAIVDVQTNQEGHSTLRTWVIQSKTGPDSNDNFNNIQLTFSVNQDLASKLISMRGGIDRQSLTKLLQNETTKLERIIVSDNASGDGKKLVSGIRFDLDDNALSKEDYNSNQLLESLNNVIESIKKSV